MPEQSSTAGQADRDDILILAQVDNVSGEDIAYVMTGLYDAGARNVNLVPSLTKKGRPGYLLLVDTPTQARPGIEKILVAELGLLGWRLLTGQHIALEKTISEKELALEIRGRTLSIKIPIKHCRTSDGHTIQSIDYEFCLDVKRRLQDEFDTDLPLRELRAVLLGAVVSGNPRVALR
jgi:uncharacterized protein (DUF111 family)